MRVAFDEQIFLFQKTGGISRYYVNLITWLRDHPDLGVRPDLPFRRVWNDYAAADLTSYGVKMGPAPLAPYPMLVAAAARPRRRGRPDLVHHTFYHRRFLRDYPKTPRVSSLHDMIPELFPESVPGNVHMAKAEYYRRADLLLVNSESARADFVSLYGEPTAPMVVTPLGVDESFAAGGRPVRGFPGRYVLYVGRRGGYKDFSVLLDAFAPLAAGDPDLHLVAVGGGGFSPDEQGQITRLHMGARVMQRDLSDAELPGAYSNASVFVMPSRYEGFGIPVLEAMAAGAPVVATDISSLPEVGGDAARYFPPQDADALATQIAGVIGDEALGEQMRAQGRKRAAEFTWERTARLTAEAYGTVLEGAR